MDMFVSSTAFAAAPAAIPASPDASMAHFAAAASLLDYLALGRAVDTPALRAAMCDASAEAARCRATHCRDDRSFLSRSHSARLLSAAGFGSGFSHRTNRHRTRLRDRRLEAGRGRLHHRCAL